MSCLELNIETVEVLNITANCTCEDETTSTDEEQQEETPVVSSASKSNSK